MTNTKIIFKTSNMCELHKLAKITKNTTCDIGLRLIFRTGKSIFEMQYMEKKEQFYCEENEMPSFNIFNIFDRI